MGQQLEVKHQHNWTVGISTNTHHCSYCTALTDKPTHITLPTVQPSQTYLLHSPHRPTNTHHSTYCTALTVLPTHITLPTVQPSQTYQHITLPTAQPSQTYQHTSLYLLDSPHRPTNTHHSTYCTALTDLPTHITLPTVQTYQHTSLYLLYSPHRPTNTHHSTYCTARTDLPTHITLPTVQPSHTYQHTSLYLLYTPLGTYSASDITLSSSSGNASSSISPRTAADETLNDSGMSSADCMRLSQPETYTVVQAMLWLLRYKTCPDSI